MPTQAASASSSRTPRKFEELRRAATNEVSASLSCARLHASSPQPPRADIQVPYTLGPNIASNLYHVPIVRSQLTRALPVLLPELRDEIVCAFGDAVGMSDEWKAVPAMEVYKGGMPTQAASASSSRTPRKFEELRRAATNEVSASLSCARLHASSPQPPRADIQVPYTLGPNIASNLYHVPIVRSQLTRALPVLLPELRDEIVCAFGDAVGMSDEWKAVPAMEVVMDVVARTSNRLSFSIDVFTGAAIVSLFPSVFKPIARRLLTKVPQRIARVMKHLQPMIEERGKDWQDKPLIRRMTCSSGSRIPHRARNAPCARSCCGYLRSILWLYIPLPWHS
ncbi:hypothetical protein POSPLADRAFT_1074160 [Postia placenta MAD-698-R-SB12]|uniref:Uncharacterized protein n=1 Tax=Postia placenta MAD-698-R-SB12 TaxID=670580 RepID=A0A1X6N238_9APHY|nr:hypothetical protein POSPLADRAFT_1074160 [Postia placenta MAD-698-R-SB12]OSX62542.1 hypothetical protein POSPLADRAFT_1074160 [Postia placenta MAD-698-R-SB12]